MNDAAMPAAGTPGAVRGCTSDRATKNKTGRDLAAAQVEALWNEIKADQPPPLTELETPLEITPYIVSSVLPRLAKGVKPATATKDERKAYWIAVAASAPLQKASIGFPIAKSSPEACRRS